MLSNSSQYTQLNDLAAFVCVIKTGSFTAAAQQLNTSKSVISKYITRLESRLGVKLLIRTTRSLTLTEIGRTFYDGVAAGMDNIDKAEQAVSLLQATPRGTLKINAPLSFGTLHIAPVVKNFLKNYPELQLDLRFEDRHVDIINDGFDLTVRITEQLEGNYIARKIASCHHVLVASQEYIKQHGAPQQATDLHDHNIISYQYQNSPWEWELVKPNGNSSRIKITGHIQMNNSLAIKEAVLHGAGIARMPTFIVGDSIKQGELIQILPQYKLLELAIYIVFPNREYMPPKVRAFIDFMVQRLEGTPYWDNF